MQPHPYWFNLKSFFVMNGDAMICLSGIAWYMMWCHCNSQFSVKYSQKTLPILPITICGEPFVSSILTDVCAGVIVMLYIISCYIGNRSNWWKLFENCDFYRVYDIFPAVQKARKNTIWFYVCYSLEFLPPTAITCFHFICSVTTYTESR